MTPDPKARTENLPIIQYFVPYASRNQNDNDFVLVRFCPSMQLPWKLWQGKTILCLWRLIIISFITWQWNGRFMSHSTSSQCPGLMWLIWPQFCRCLKLFGSPSAHHVFKAGVPSVHFHSSSCPLLVMLIHCLSDSVARIQINKRLNQNKLLKLYWF